MTHAPDAEESVKRTATGHDDARRVTTLFGARPLRTGMSDGDDPEGFDREAQKRELREKYAKDAEDRERTSRMSELLLQGATMTNEHCDRCGNPLFRYEGREFCPTCQAEGEPDAAAANTGTADASADAADAAKTADASADAHGADDSGPSTGAPTTSVTNVADVDAESPESHAHDVRAEPAEPTNAAATLDTGSAASTDANTGTTDASTREADALAAGERAPDAGGDPNAPTADTPAARAALSRSVARLAERAAAADDPRSAREFAEAAREAAAALDTLR